jgi:hypothetical protein
MLLPAPWSSLDRSFMSGVDELVHELGEARRDVGRLKFQARFAGYEVPSRIDELAAEAVHAVNGYFDRIEEPGLLLEAWSAVFRLQNTIAAIRAEIDRSRRLGAQAAMLRHRAASLVATSREAIANGQPLMRTPVSITVIGDPPPDLPVWETAARVAFARMTNLAVVLRQEGAAWRVEEAQERDDEGKVVADWRPHVEAAFQAAGLAVVVTG